MSIEVKKEPATERVSPPAALIASPLNTGDSIRNLPPFSSFSGDVTMDSGTTLTTLHSQDIGLGLTSPWDYYEGLTGRLIDSRGEVVLANQYRPWESKHGGMPPNSEGLPSFASQFAPPSESEPQLTALTPLSPASISHSPPVTSAVGLPSFHTLGSPLPLPPPPLPVPLPQSSSSSLSSSSVVTASSHTHTHTHSHSHRTNIGYPLVPAPVQAREVPGLQQQLLDERHIQLLGPTTVSTFVPPPPQSTGGGAVGNGNGVHPHHTVLTVVKQEYPQLHHANFQNPMSTVLDSSPTSRTTIGGIDGRKKERRKIRAGSMESEDGANVESSGQVAAVSSTANRGQHHMSGGMGDNDNDGNIGDKPTKKKT